MDMHLNWIIKGKYIHNYVRYDESVENAKCKINMKAYHEADSNMAKTNDSVHCQQRSSQF